MKRSDFHLQITNAYLVDAAGKRTELPTVNGIHIPGGKLVPGDKLVIDASGRVHDDEFYLLSDLDKPLTLTVIADERRPHTLPYIWKRKGK